jgi:hypothetical protein
MKPFDEQHIDYGSDTPQYDRKQMKLVSGDHVVLKFDDLCPDCEGVVEGLVQRLRMEPDKRRVRKDKDKDKDAIEAKEVAEPSPAAPVVEAVPTKAEPLF